MEVGCSLDVRQHALRVEAAHCIRSGFFLVCGKKVWNAVEADRKRGGHCCHTAVAVVEEDNHLGRWEMVEQVGVEMIAEAEQSPARLEGVGKIALDLKTTYQWKAIHVGTRNPTYQAEDMPYYPEELSII